MSFAKGALIFPARFVLIIFSALFFLPAAVACDADDALPGALPPAPHGGALSQFEIAKELTISDEGKSGEGFPLFWEGSYRKRQSEIDLFLVKVLPPKIAIFATASPLREVSEIDVKIELPRAGKTIAVPFQVSQEKIVVKFSSGELNRFIVRVTGLHAGKLHTARIQIEDE